MQYFSAGLESHVYAFVHEDDLAMPQHPITPITTTQDIINQSNMSSSISVSVQAEQDVIRAAAARINAVKERAARRAARPGKNTVEGKPEWLEKIEGERYLCALEECGYGKVSSSPGAVPCLPGDILNRTSGRIKRRQGGTAGKVICPR